METKTTFLKLSLIALFLFISSTAFSATYYVCSGATITLSDPPVVQDLTYTWDVKLGGLSVGYPGSPGKPTSMPTTPGIYTILLSSTSNNIALCAPDVAEHTIIVLPQLSLTSSAPTNPTYCGSTANSSSVIALTGTLPSLPTDVTGPPAAPYSTDLDLEYSYSVVKTVGTVTDAAVDGVTAGLGTINATTKAFTLTTNDVGSYAITASVKYKQKTGTVTGTLLGTTGCQATSTQTVVVIATPAAPTITVS